MYLIDREKTIDFILTDMRRMSWNQARNDAINGFVKRMKKVPEVDAVPRSAYDQVKWERDIAIAQLHECGIAFGEKVDREILNIKA